MPNWSKAYAGPEELFYPCIANTIYHSTCLRTNIEKSRKNACSQQFIIVNDYAGPLSVFCKRFLLPNILCYKIIYFAKACIAEIINASVVKS